MRVLLRVIGPDKVAVTRVCLDDLIMLRKFFAPAVLPYRDREQGASTGANAGAHSAPSAATLDDSSVLGDALLFPHERIFLQWMADLAATPSVRALMLDPAFVQAFISVKLADWYVSGTLRLRASTYLLIPGMRCVRVCLHRLEFMIAEVAQLTKLVATAFAPLDMASSSAAASPAAPAEHVWRAMATCIQRIIRQPLTLELLKICWVHSCAIIATSCA